MAVSFSVPKSPAKSVFEINQFLGVDLTNQGTNIDERRSPNAPNMVRDVPGKVRKRRGYEVMHNFGNGTVFGAHTYKAVDSVDLANVNRCKTVGYNDFETYDPLFYGQTLYVEFDYSSEKDFYFEISGTNGQSEKVNVKAGVGHYSGSVTLNKDINASYYSDGYHYNYSRIYFSQYKVAQNVSVMYKKDSTYKWQKAPEEDGQKFPNEKPFNIKGIVQQIPSASSNPYVVTYTASKADEYITFKSGSINGKSYGINDALWFYAEDYRFRRLTQNGDFYIRATYVKPTGQSVYYNYIFDRYSQELNMFIPAVLCDGSYITAWSLAVKLPTVGLQAEVTYSGKPITITAATIKRTMSDVEISTLYHVGTNLYNDAYGLIYDKMQPDYSHSFQLNEYLYIIDGSNYLRLNTNTNLLENVIEDNLGYIPTITISKAPNGGGTSYEDLNLIQPGFTETFICDNDLHPGSESATDFYLSFSNLDSTTVKVWELYSTGWVEYKENLHFTVDRSLGRVTLQSPAGKTPVTGEPNIKITAFRTVPGYASRIAKCTIGTLFGVGGSTDRLFLSGNENYPNYDWYSQQNDLTYFPDVAYSTLGQAKSAIVGYSIINNYLATHKDENEPSQSVFIREGDLIDNEPSFKLINTLQGAGAIAKNSFNYLETEPLFLTRKGIFSITAQDITGEKYGQNRSFYLNGQLLQESQLEDAVSVVYNDYYILGINDKLYILDGLQAMQTDKSAPFSTRQYAGFYCTNIPAKSFWVEDNDLWFGTADGRICRFYPDKSSQQAYNDNGEAIEACWETPDLDGKLFFKNKTFRYVAIRLMAALSTSVKIYGMKRGIWNTIKEDEMDIWTLIKEDDVSARYFSFENITFSKFTWSVDRSEKVAHSKTRIKKVDKARFKLENNKLNEPFGIYNFAVEYVESGNYKG